MGHNSSKNWLSIFYWLFGEYSLGTEGEGDGEEEENECMLTRQAE